MLSENDAKVLKAISQGCLNLLDILHKLGMKQETAIASADALGEQGLVTVIKSVYEVVSLTNEGKYYAQVGLPERRLLSFIGPGKAMSELKDPDNKIGLGWLRKKGWATIQGGEIKPVGDAPRGKDEEILQVLLLTTDLKRSAELDKKGLSDLKGRGLVDSRQNKE